MNNTIYNRKTQLTTEQQINNRTTQLITITTQLTTITTQLTREQHN